MAKYMAMRIMEGAFTLKFVISKRPDLGNAIIAELKNEGRFDLLVLD